MIRWPYNRILQLKDRGAVVIIRVGGRHRKAVAGLKGAAAEGGGGETPSGQTDNIRLTVANAERYVLIVFSLPGHARQEA